MSNTPLSGLANLSTNQKAINAAVDAQKNAAISKNADDRPRYQLRVPIALDTAATSGNPYPINNPFDGFYVESATDGATTVNMSLTSPEAQNILNYTAIKQNDAANFDAPLRGCYLTWAAQPGKIITIVFYLGIGFRPGSLNTVITGGVTLSNGTGMTPVASVSVTSTATSILAANTARKKATIQNLGSSYVYLSGVNTVVGNSGSAGGTIGVRLLPGESYEWVNTGAIWGICDSGGTSLVGINTET